MSDWNKGYQDGLGGSPPPTDSVGYAGWAAAQRLREENEARLRGGSGSGSSADGSTSTPLTISFADPSPSGGAYTGPADPAAARAGLKGLAVAAALVLFSAVTIPAAAAAVIGGPVLMLSIGQPRPALGRAFVAAFLGLCAYMATLGAALSASVAMTGVSLGATMPDRWTPGVIGAIAIGQVAALAGFAFVSAWWAGSALPTLGGIARAFVAGVVTVVLFIGAVLGTAWKLGLA